MKLRDVMTNPVIRINPEESVAVAARTLDRYNIGALPVCGSDGRLCGLVTDRDIVTRCLAGRTVGLVHARPGRDDGEGDHRPAGHGGRPCGGADGQGTDQKAARHGERKALRHGQSGRSGNAGRNQH